MCRACRATCDEECDCECHDDDEVEAEFDADELGLDPEEDDELPQSLNERLVRLLLRRPLYPGEVIDA